MSHRIRRRALVTALAPLVFAIGACASHPVSPLPAGPTGTAPSASPVPSVSTSATPSPGRTRTPAPTRTGTRPTPTPSHPSACLGTVVFTIDAGGSEPVPPSLCLTVGGVLRVESIENGTLSASPAGKVSQEYEAGIINVRFLAAGTVTLTFPVGGRPFTMTVVVVT